MQLLVERVLTLMQHCGHPPREVGAPSASRWSRFLANQVDEDGSEQGDVGDGEVETLGAGRRDDVGGVAGRRKRRPCLIGVWTNDRIGSTLLSVIGPVVSSQPSLPWPSRVASASQIRSSDHSSGSVPFGTCR